MKKLSFSFLCAVVGFGCSTGYKVVQPISRPLGSYRSVAVPAMDTAKWLAAHPEVESEGKYANWHKEVGTASDRIPAIARANLGNRFTVASAPAPGSLTIATKLEQFNPGSRAARYFVGFGAGKGRMDVLVTLVDTDSGSVVGSANVGCNVVGGLFGGSIQKAYDYCGTWAARFVLDHAEKAGEGK